MAIEESNPAVHQLGEVPSADATSAPVARPLKLSPYPRSPLPKRDPSRGRHWFSDDPEQLRNQRTVGELLARNKAEHYNTDVQARLDAAERAS